MNPPPGPPNPPTPPGRPPGPPPGPPWPPPGWRPPPSSGSSGGVVVALTFVGIIVFVFINLMAFFATITVADSVRGDGKLVVVGVAAVLLAAIALVGGIVLIMLRKPWSKGLGLGLMIGWALVSIGTAGFCTGVNPSIYVDGAL
ncbi:hypothetical protein [Sphaerimonospora mesophila]|uniref:hypothetical protein n=1 Tax=Sphaerimonospora mesophila TaxID=37483 RepID=UPI000AAEB7F1